MRKQTMIAAAVVAAALAGPAVAQGGQAYQSAEHKFSLTMPEGWSAQPLTDPSGAQVQFNAPSGNSNCNVFKVPYQPWAAYSQTQINNEIANNIFKGEIETEMNQAGQNGRVSVNEPRSLGSVNIQYAEYEFDFTGDNGQPVRVYIQKLMSAVPGMVYNVNCAALSSDAAAIKPSFNLLMSTFTMAP